MFLIQSNFITLIGKTEKMPFHLAKKLIFLIVTIACTGIVRAQETVSLTDSLVRQFHAAWNANHLEGMVAQLQPDAFFKSPHQLRYGRDVMAATVLTVNPPVIKDCDSEEWHSHMDGEVAWSIGRLYCNSYDEDGNITKRGTDKSTEYTYLFTKDQAGRWKLQMLLFHE